MEHCILAAMVALLFAPSGVWRQKVRVNPACRTHHTCGASEHCRHHGRRSWPAGDQLLRQQAHPDAQHRPPGPRRDAIRRGDGQQLDLLAVAGDDAHGQVQPPVRRAGSWTIISTAPSRPSRNCCNRPATRPPSSASGTSSASRPDSISTACCRGMGDTTTARSRRRANRGARMATRAAWCTRATSPTSSRTSRWTGWQSAGRTSPSAC